MDLQIAVFLLFVLFTGGHAFSCLQCKNQTDSCSQVSNCSSGISNCVGSTVNLVNFNVTLNVKDCAASNSCANGSINLGFGKVSSYCCNTEKCNAQDAPVFGNTTTGKSCFYCDGKNCTNTVNCTEIEDRCITATGNVRNQTETVKGCASKSFCDGTASIPNIQNITCCEGNLCNGAQSVTQSFLFLCGSLISYFLLH